MALEHHPVVHPCLLSATWCNNRSRFTKAKVATRACDSCSFWCILFSAWFSQCSLPKMSFFHFPGQMPQRSLCSIFRIVSEALFKCGHLTKQFLIPCGFFLYECSHQHFYSKHKVLFTSHFSSLRLQGGMAFLLHFAVLRNSAEILSPYRNKIRVVCMYSDNLYLQVFKQWSEHLHPQKYFESLGTLF